MNQLLMAAVLMFCGAFPAFAQQSVMDELKNTCEVSGGRWVISGGNWACCWSDWGCYGCADGLCRMKCETQRCKDANGQKRPKDGLRPGEIKIQGLAPAGKKQPIIPKKARPGDVRGTDILNKKF